MIYICTTCKEEFHEDYVRKQRCPICYSKMKEMEEENENG